MPANHMLRELRQFTPRTFWTIAAGAALVLGAVVAVPQWLSKRARLEVLRSHVGQVAQLAASVVDGDLHRKLLDPANYTPELYARTLEPLVRFHSADPEIFYVYTMVEKNGKSYFVVDTAASAALVTPHSLRASAYMEPFETLDKEPDPDWLQRLSSGKTYVYPRLLRDEYGYFLSGHAPIYDRQHRYSGFVGVDFDIQYYLRQEAGFRTIYFGTLAAALLAALIIAYFAARYDFQARKRIEEQFQSSIHDELTGVMNRRGALMAINRALATQTTTHAAILVDVDDLKAINDNHGHAVGDDFLTRVAGALRSSVRDTDICARLGGDEFFIFASGCDLDAATEIARRILAKVYTPDAALGTATFGVSIGICVASPPDANFEAMYRGADHALYKAKTAGKNRYVIFQPVAATG